jgi:hypothetical protein
VSAYGAFGSRGDGGLLTSQLQARTDFKVMCWSLAVVLVARKARVPQGRGAHLELRNRAAGGTASSHYTNDTWGILHTLIYNKREMLHVLRLIYPYPNHELIPPRVTKRENPDAVIQNPKAKERNTRQLPVSTTSSARLYIHPI